MSTPRKRHKHKWSRQYRGIFNRPVRVCLNGRCGGIRFLSGHIVHIMERVPKKQKDMINAARVAAQKAAWGR